MEVLSMILLIAASASLPQAVAPTQIQRPPGIVILKLIGMSTPQSEVTIPTRLFLRITVRANDPKILSDRKMPSKAHAKQKPLPLSLLQEIINPSKGTNIELQ
jgi:hypothetical protein